MIKDHEIKAYLGALEVIVRPAPFFHRRRRLPGMLLLTLSYCRSRAYNITSTTTTTTTAKPSALITTPTTATTYYYYYYCFNAATGRRAVRQFSDSSCVAKKGPLCLWSMVSGVICVCDSRSEGKQLQVQ